jgi:hypothetical protein
MRPWKLYKKKLRKNMKLNWNKKLNKKNLLLDGEIEKKFN